MMHTWTVTATQTEDAWQDDYIRDVLNHAPPTLPPHDQKIGHVEVHWHQTSPGLVYCAANPNQGTVDDRIYAESLIMSQLRAHGLKQAVYTASHSVTANSWGVSDKVQEKAKRLIQSGSVHLDRNGYDEIAAHVEGDGTDNDGTPDTHQVAIRMQNPQQPGKVTGAFCDCDWGQFLNTPRTRRWKQFQYTPCSHIVATSWLAQSVPKDEDRAPGNAGEPGQMSLFDQSGGEAPSSMGLMRQNQGYNPNSWFMQSPETMPESALSPPMPMGENGGGGGGGQMVPPPPEAVLPQFPMDPSMMPQVNPASIPGGRPGPTPTNPLQYPGGTFSSIGFGRMRYMAAQTYQNGQLARLKQETMGTLVGRSQEHGAGQQVSMPAGSVGEVLGTDPTTQMVNVLFMGKQFNTNTYFEPFGAQAWCWPSEIVPAPGTPPGPAIKRMY